MSIKHTNSKQRFARRTCLLVNCVRTISSSGITCAGLKKWAPTTRSWVEGCNGSSSNSKETDRQQGHTQEHNLHIRCNAMVSQMLPA